MDHPKRQAWLYVVVGLAAIASAIYFLATDTGEQGDFALLDWGILAMGVVAVYRGTRMFMSLRSGDDAPTDPGDSTTFRRKLPPPGQN